MLIEEFDNAQSASDINISTPVHSTKWPITSGTNTSVTKRQKKRITGRCIDDESDASIWVTGGKMMMMMMMRFLAHFVVKSILFYAICNSISPHLLVIGISLPSYSYGTIPTTTRSPSPSTGKEV